MHQAAIFRQSAGQKVSQHYFLVNSYILHRFASCLEWKQQRKTTLKARASLANLKHSLSLPANLPKEGTSWLCCGLQWTVKKAPFTRRSKFVILATNIYFWSHFAVVVFNLVDFVKDITFATAVQHFDTNIVQSFSDRRYEQYFDFNVFYVFVISVGLMVAAQVVTYLYWLMITKKPKFLLACEHQGLATRALLQLVQYIPSTLPTVLFAQDSAVKLELGEQEDALMDPNNFHHHLELLSEERLLEKLALNIKIIEVVVEAYGQLIIQSVVLLRLRALIQTDYFKYFGISFEYVIIISMVFSIFSIFTTFWSYHIRSKQYFRQAVSAYTLLQLVTWILLITTKLIVYVVAFINFPALFFIPILLQFLVTGAILSFSNVSPSFKASPWHDRMIHCMVCCVLPLAVSECPQWQLEDVYSERVEGRCKVDSENKEDGTEQEEEGAANVGFDDDAINLDSLTHIIKKDKLKRVNTIMYQAEMEKKSRGEMMLALFLYTFECFSVASFSAVMYRFYHFESYRDFLENFVKEHASFLSFLPVPGFYGVVVALMALVTGVVVFSGLLIMTYYKRLHPRLTMFSVGREGHPSHQGETPSTRRL